MLRYSGLWLPGLPLACWLLLAFQLLAFGLRRNNQALPPSARYERRVGVSLVRAAWERRPEGPAYLLSDVKLLYLAGQCAFFCTNFPPLDQWHSKGFPEFLRTDSFCSS